MGKVSGGMETRVETYKDQKSYERNLWIMTRIGWRVVSTTELRQGAGIGRMLTLGFFAAARPPKSKIVVTYERERNWKQLQQARKVAEKAAALSALAPIDYVICPRCGARVTLESHFCQNCGLPRINPPA